MGVESLVCFIPTHSFTLLSKKYVRIYISLRNVWKYPITYRDVRDYHTFDYMPSTGEVVRSQDYFYLQITFSKFRTLSHIYWSTCSISCLFLFFGSFSTEMSIFLLSVTKAFTILNITTLFYYPYYKYLFPNLLLIYCLKYIFSYTHFKCLYSKYFHILFHSF